MPVKKPVLLLASLAMLPLSAQTWELGAFVGQQSRPSFKVADSFSTNTVTFPKKNVVGLRLGYAVLDVGPVLLQATAGYQPQASVTYKETFTDANPPRTTDYKTGHMSVGAMLNLKSLVSVGAGMEYRLEKIELGSESTTYGRPWVRVNAGLAIPTPVVKPFLGVEAAFALTSIKIDDAGSTADFLRVLAPKAQVGVYAGVRF